MDTDFFCGQVGCAALGMAFIAALMFLVTVGWLYELWRQWVSRYLEHVEGDIRRMLDLNETDEGEATQSDDEEAA